MGFRNPVTTASALDTAAGRVRIYETTQTTSLGTTYKRGIIEFTSGVNGEAGATFEMDSTPDANNNSQGTSVVLYGSDVTVPNTSTLVQAPRLELSTGPGADPLQAPSVWASVAHLVASDAIILDAPSVEINAPIKASNNMVAVTFPAAWTDYGSGFGPTHVRKDASGVVHLWGMVKPVSANQAAPSTIATVPAAFRPTATFSGAVQYGSATCRVDINSAGVIQLAAGSIPVSGGYLMLNMSWPGPDLAL